MPDTLPLAETPTLLATEPCLCGSGLPYGNCCQPYHLNQALAPTPEATMRSRYVAYALGLVDYLMATTHRDNPGFSKQAKLWRAELARYCLGLTCLGLHIAQCTPASAEITPEVPASGDKGVVVFMAKLQQGEGSPPYAMHETSIFKRANRRWLYYSGDNRLSPVTPEAEALFVVAKPAKPARKPRAKKADAPEAETSTVKVPPKETTPKAAPKAKASKAPASPKVSSPKAKKPSQTTAGQG